MDGGLYGIDAARFRPQLIDCVVHYQPLCCGIGPSGQRNTSSIPPLKSVSIHKARRRAMRAGFRPWFEEPAGFHIYAFGQWQFMPPHWLS